MRSSSRREWGRILGEDLIIQLTNASQATLEGRKHFFFQERDFLLPIGPIHPGAPQGTALETGQDLLNGMEGGFQEQEGIFLRAAERRRRDRGCGHDG
jgi:hypothetical protein